MICVNNVVGVVLLALIGIALADPGYFFPSEPKYTKTYYVKSPPGGGWGPKPSPFSQYSVFSKPSSSFSSSPYGSSPPSNGGWGWGDETDFTEGSYEDEQVPSKPYRSSSGSKTRGNAQVQMPDEVTEEEFSNAAQDEEISSDPNVQTQSMDDIYNSMMMSMEAPSPNPQQMNEIQTSQGYRSQPSRNVPAMPQQRRPQMMVINSVQGGPTNVAEEEVVVEMNPENEIETEEMGETPGPSPGSGGWGQAPTGPGGRSNRGRPSSRPPPSSHSASLEEDGYKPGLPPYFELFGGSGGQGWPSSSGPASGDIPEDEVEERPTSVRRPPPRKTRPMSSRRPSSSVGSSPSRNPPTRPNNSGPPASRNPSAKPNRPTSISNVLSGMSAALRSAFSSGAPQGQRTPQRPVQQQPQNPRPVSSRPTGGYPGGSPSQATGGSVGGSQSQGNGASQTTGGYPGSQNQGTGGSVGGSQNQATGGYPGGSQSQGNGASQATGGYPGSQSQGSGGSVSGNQNQVTGGYPSGSQSTGGYPGGSSQSQNQVSGGYPSGGQTNVSPSAGQGQSSSSSSGESLPKTNEFRIGNQVLSAQDGLLDEDLIRTVQQIISTFDKN